MKSEEEIKKRIKDLNRLINRSSYYKYHPLYYQKYGGDKIEKMRFEARILRWVLRDGKKD